jgi:hypothetical protein
MRDLSRVEGNLSTSNVHFLFNQPFYQTEGGILMKTLSKEEEGKLRRFLKGLGVDVGECEPILKKARRSLAKVIE